jgi:heme-degrading monooxygenase HmoA
MTMAVVLHRVTDYDTFRKGYDEADPVRRAAGVLEQSVHRMVDDPDNVLVIHYFESLEAAQDFFNHPLFVEVNNELGVGPMRIEYYD